MGRMTLDRFVELGLDNPGSEIRTLSPEELRRKKKILEKRRKAGKAAADARKRQRRGKKRN